MSQAKQKILLRSKTAVGRLHMAVALLLVLVVGSPLVAFEQTDVLHAIHQVENPTNTLRSGRYGELGPYQFRQSVWQSYTDKPFSLATDRAEADIVARQHYEWIARGLERNGIEVTPYHIALAWNAGLSATVNGRAPASSRQYATRVSNLVESDVGGGAFAAR